MTQLQKLGILSSIKQCKICPLHKNMKVCPVPGIGLNSAKIMFIAESSNNDEDLLTKPCVGVSGHFFKNCLDRINIPYSDIYYTNIIKCICKDKKEEKVGLESCKKWLWKEIQSIQPKVIVTLGKLPSTTLLHKQIKRSVALKTIVCKEFAVDYCDSIIIPSYHPNYILIRGKKYEKTFIEILINAKKLKDR